MSKQQVSDPSKGRYFVQVLNMTDDDLGPYEMRLLVHYIRVAAKTGKCWEGIRKTSQVTQMSMGMVSKTRNRLMELGYIRVKHREDDTCVIVIVDRMAENIARYAHESAADDMDEFDAPSGVKRSSGEQGVHVVRGGVHVVNTLEGSSVHVVNERIQEPKELEPEKKIKYIAPSGADDISLLGNPDDLLLDAQGMSPLPEGEKQRAAKGKNAETRLSQTTATTPPPSPTPSAPKLKSILAWVIDDAWAGHEGKHSDAAGMSMRLIPVLMGTSKKHDRVDPVASEAEIYGFTRWYRWMHPNTPLPMESKLASWFGQWRASSEYLSRLETAQHMVSRLYHAESSPPVIEEEYVPLDHPAYAKFDALLARTIIGGDL